MELPPFWIHNYFTDQCDFVHGDDSLFIQLTRRFPRSKRLFGRGSTIRYPILPLDCTGRAWLGCGYQLQGSKFYTRLHYRRGHHRHIVVFEHHRSRYNNRRMDFDPLGGALVATAFAPELEGHSFAVL
jgi:hypothetical protein